MSYAHQDGRYRETIALHLEVLRREKRIHVWTDKAIIPGEEWDKAIRSELDRADIVIFLVSTAFLASKYINRVEVKTAMKRHDDCKAVVVPVILEKSSWQTKVWKKCQALPNGEKAVRDWKPQRNGWYEVEMGLRKVISALKEKLRALETERMDSQSRQ